MRQTHTVKKVLEIMEAAHKPISVPELQTKLSDLGFTPNKTTLYRMLEKLETEDVVQSLLLDPKVIYYEFKTHHHHHFRCDSCDEIQCITDPDLESKIHALEDKLASKGLTINDHHFSLSGKCTAC